MNVSEILLFCSSSFPACKPCFQFIRASSWLASQIQIVRLDTEEQRRRAINGDKFQIRYVPTLVAIYEDGDTSVYQGAKKVISWLHMMTKSAEASSPNLSEEEANHPPAEPSNLYSGAKPATAEIEEIEEVVHSGDAESSQPKSISSLDINANRKQEAEGTSMGKLVNAARAMEQSRQTHLSSVGDAGANPRMPLRTFN